MRHQCMATLLRALSPEPDSSNHLASLEYDPAGQNSINHHADGHK